MVKISEQTVDDIVSHLDLIKENVTDEKSKLAISKIKNDLNKSTFLNKIQVVDKLNHLIHYTNSLKEQMYILDNEITCMNVNVCAYTYAIADNLDYLYKQLNDLKEAIENLYDEKNKDT